MVFDEIIQKRRAYRALIPVEITGDDIARMAGSARLFCSCFNNQPWRYVFVTDPEILTRLFSTLSGGNQWAEKASMIIAVASQPELDCIIKKRQYYQFDTGMATAALILKATEMGLVAHPIAGFDPHKAAEHLNIPGDMEIITLVIVGKQGTDTKDLNDRQIASERERPPRLPLEKIMFRNQYRQ